MNNVVPVSSNMPRNFSNRELTTIKATVAKDTNDQEFDLFMAYCIRKGLDPFAKEAIAVVFHKNDPNKRQMQIITTQAGLRSTALDHTDYSPERTPPVYEYDENLKGPINPLGIVSCTVTLWKKDVQANEWYPVVGVAYWDEYVPIKTDDVAFEYVSFDPPQFWDNKDGTPSKREKKRKVMKQGVDPSEMQSVDDSGQWKKMPRNQIAKCARMQALRAGWKEYSGIYSEDELHRAIAEDKSASELVEQDREERRMKLISAGNDDYPFLDENADLVSVPAGRYADRMIEVAKLCATPESLDSHIARNKEWSNRFWAKHKDDGLQMKKELEDIRKALPKPEKREG